MHRQAGFSLIELVVVIVLVGIAAVALLQQFSQAAGTLGRNEQLQTAAQLAQQGAEQVLALRRSAGYTDPGLDPGSSTENLAGLFAGYNRTVSIDAPATGACPPLAQCKDVQVTVDRGAGTLAQIDLVLVDY
jgi:prepilin-type N-terminal cleavage/methylation domain-containing protein